MIKILVIITTSFVSYGGLTTVAMNYYRSIDHSRFHMDFASVNEIPDSLRTELEKNISKYYKLPSRTHRPFAYINSLRWIAKEYDVVHVHANSATAVIDLLPAKLAGAKKRVLHIHNTTCTHKVIHSILNPLLRNLYTDAIACSDKAGAWIFQMGTYVVLNNAIDTERYQFIQSNRDKIRDKLHVDNRTVLIGNVGKINEQKNHSFLVDIFKEYKEKNFDSKLIIIGDGSLRADLEKKIKDLHLENDVILTGMVDDATPYYSAMDAFVFPSLWEGFPLSLIEAQTNGLPCITSVNVTGEANVTRSVKYLDFEHKDLWCDAIEGLIKNNIAANRAKISIENIRMIKKSGFDIKTNAVELEKIYEH